MKSIVIPETEQYLKTLMSTTKNENKRVRLHALLLRKSSPKSSMGEIATQLNANRRTVERWLSLYLEGGIKEMCKVKRIGSRLRKTLNEQQQDKLRMAIENGMVKTYQDARFWIFKEFGIALDYKNVSMFILKQLGMSLSTRIKPEMAPKSLPLQGIANAIY